MPVELLLAILIILLLKDDFKIAINEIPTQSKILLILVIGGFVFVTRMPEFNFPFL